LTIISIYTNINNAILTIKERLKMGDFCMVNALALMVFGLLAVQKNVDEIVETLLPVLLKEKAFDPVNTESSIRHIYKTLKP
jgi:hypothetical protein